MDYEKIIGNQKMYNRSARVRRLKAIKVFLMIMFFILPIIFCVLMLFKIKVLEEKVDSLVSVCEKEHFVSETINVVDNDAVVCVPDKEKPVDEDPDLVDVDESVDDDNKEFIEAGKVYLTFDDGPSIYTDNILDILQEHQVKATFFVIGKTDEDSKRLYKRIVDEGHTLAMHSYSHQYKQIYSSLKEFKKDVTKISDLIYETTGVRPKYYRFPGGSSNQVSDVAMSELITYLNKQDITYFDWNVVNGDATGETLSKHQLIKNVLKGVRQHENSMVLMHDTVTKKLTIDSLPLLLAKLKKENYSILPIDENTKVVQHVKAGSVK